MISSESLLIPFFSYPTVPIPPASLPVNFQDALLLFCLLNHPFLGAFLKLLLTYLQA
jgi:hypothetical protein